MMAEKLRSGGSNPLKPVPPPKPKSASNDVISKIEDLTARFTHLEEKTSLLYDDMQKKNNQLSEEISLLRSHITTLQRNHTSLQHNHAKLQKEHKVLHQRLTELNLYLEAFQTDFNKALSDQSSLKEEQERLKTEVHSMEPDQHTLQSSVETLPIQQADVEKVQLSTDNVASPSHHHAGVEDVTVTQLVALVRQFQTDHSQWEAHIQSHLSQFQTDHSQWEAHIQSQLSQLQTDHSQCEAHIQSHLSKLQTDHSQCEAHIQSQLSQLQTDHSQCEAHIQSHLSHLETDHSQWKANIARLQAAQAELATSHSNMRGEMESSCSAIKELKTKLRKTRTLFSACNLNKDQSDYYKAMVFNTITNNKDGHYDAQTGVFTTPYAGLYIFTATLASSSPVLNPLVYSHIMVDDTMVCSVLGGVNGGSACVPVSLEPGQKVWLQPRNAIKNYESGNVCSSFSGTLMLLLP